MYNRPSSLLTHFRRKNDLMQSSSTNKLPLHPNNDLSQSELEMYYSRRMAARKAEAMAAEVRETSETKDLLS